MIDKPIGLATFTGNVLIKQCAMLWTTRIQLSCTERIPILGSELMVVMSLRGQQDEKTVRRMPDETMEQVRDLLFGEFARAYEERVSRLESRVRELEAQGRLLEDDLQKQIKTLTAQVDRVIGELATSQRQAVDKIDKASRQTLDEIGTGLRELGERINRKGNAT
ncbi:MAG: hypothetical protein ACR2PG_02560 [Hyphomicrobiaceae bacterium]